MVDQEIITSNQKPKRFTICWLCAEIVDWWKGHSYLKNKGNAQEWLEQNYLKERRRKIEEIYLTETSLEGELDLSDFTNLRGIFVSPQVDETKLVFKNQGENIRIIKLPQVQKWLDYYYPKNETCIRKNETLNINNFGKKREEITGLHIPSHEKLEGNLSLNDFMNLRKLDCGVNKLTFLDVSNCEKLEEIDFSDNSLVNITLPTNPTSLKKINLKNNNFPCQDLSFLVPYVNLEEINLGNEGYSSWSKEKINQGIYNRFTGSLDYLSEMKNLKKLHVDNTDLNEVQIDKLPNNLEWIYYSAKERLDCKLFEIVPLLDKYFGKFARCSKCGLVNTSYKWCQTCINKEWWEDTRNLTGRELVEKFIEQQPADTFGRKLLQWIPYKEFTNIELLAVGGFSKIYKTKCKEIKKYYEYAEKDIILKVLNNSQNITLEFLQEVANTKLVDEREEIVRCYGISQDSQTKNYVIVMEYMKDGNLRQYLQNKNSKLSLENKLGKLGDIAQGLQTIYFQNLIHRDFHSGNILNSDGGRSLSNYDTTSYITDLGLSQPANYQKEEGKIYGILPYVSPEVLRGQSYTPVADIYSFGIIAYELLSNAYPYPEMNGLELSLKVCQGLRPNIDKVPLPQLLKDLIKKCWDASPEKRPTARELNETIWSWLSRREVKKNTPFYCQYQNLEKEYDYFSQNSPYKIYPNAITTSKLINTKKISELSQKIEEISKSAKFNMDEIDEWLKEYKEQETQNKIEIPPKS